MKRKRRTDIWAGLNLADEDAHKIKPCKFCGEPVVWLRSNRTKKFYPVNFRGIIDVKINDFHKCKGRSK